MSFTITFSEEDLKEIVFKELTTGEISHFTLLDDVGEVDYRSVIAWFTRCIMREVRFFSGYDFLYPKVESFVRYELFTTEANLEDLNTIRNLSEHNVTQTIISAFKNGINDLTIMVKGKPEIREYIKLSQSKPFIVTDQDYIMPKKSLFNRIVGDSGFELDFASFLEMCPDVIAYAKNYFSIKFKLDYVNASGDISNYYPDFFVKLANNTLVIVETKGLEDINVKPKMERLSVWCKDATALDNKQMYDYLFVDQETFENYQGSVRTKFKQFHILFDIFTRYK